MYMCVHVGGVYVWVCMCEWVGGWVGGDGDVREYNAAHSSYKLAKITNDITHTHLIILQFMMGELASR